MATALEKVRVSSTRAVTMAEEQDAATAKYMELRSSMEQCVGFANNEMASLKAELVKMTKERDASVVMA